MIHQTRGPRGCKGGGVCGRSHTPPPLHPVGSSANLSQPMSTELIDLTQTAAAELGLRPAQVAAAAKLLDGGATVPFAARYRKEATGSLDEVQITAVRDQLTRLRELEKRRESILGSLRERELLTPELEVAVCKASTRAELEDHYLPFRPKRRTRAAMARERGLGPLAGVLLAAAGTGDTQFNPGAAARDYVDPEKDVSGVDEALAGARDVIAESASEDPEVRRRMRALYPVSYTHLRAHETKAHLVCRLLLEKKKTTRSTRRSATRKLAYDTNISNLKRSN